MKMKWWIVVGATIIVLSIGAFFAPIYAVLALGLYAGLALALGLAIELVVAIIYYTIYYTRRRILTGAWVNAKKG